MLSEFWKEDAALLLTTGMTKELLAVGALANPLNTDVVDTEDEGVDVLKVGAIEGKTAAPKLIIVVGAVASIPDALFRID